MLEAKIPCFSSLSEVQNALSSLLISLLFLFFFVNKSEIWDRLTPLWHKEGKKQCIDVFLLKNVAQLTGTICALSQGSLHLCFALRLNTYACYLCSSTYNLHNPVSLVISSQLIRLPIRTCEALQNRDNPR